MLSGLAGTPFEALFGLEQLDFDKLLSPSGDRDGRVQIGDGAFRFDLQGVVDGTYRLCPSPVGVTIGTGPVDPSVTCGTAIVGPLSIGTTGRAATIDSVAPAVDHPFT